MATVKRTTGASPKAAVTKTIAELTVSIAALDTNLEEMNASLSVDICIFAVTVTAQLTGNA